MSAMLLVKNSVLLAFVAVPVYLGSRSKKFQAVKVLLAAAITSPAPAPSAPLSPLGIDIASTAAVSVPTLVTLALLPGSPVVTAQL